MTHPDPVSPVSVEEDRVDMRSALVRLNLKLARIDAINDNPSRFDEETDRLCREGRELAVAALASSPACGEGQLLGYLNIYRSEAGHLESGTSDFYDSPAEARASNASEFSECVGAAEVRLLDTALATAPLTDGGERETIYTATQLQTLLNGRDQFIVECGLWSDFVQSLADADDAISRAQGRCQ